MSPEVLEKIQDMRRRIVKKHELEAEGKEVPPELMYSTEDLREHLRLVREDRGAAVVAARKKAGPKVNLPENLNDLFD